VTSLVQISCWSVTLFLASLFAVVAVRLLTGGINTAGLLYGLRREGSIFRRYFSPERLQLLITTVAVALYYLASVLESTESHVLPPIRQELVALTGGSHAVYLAGKAFMMLRRGAQNNS
jgi:hypothetical protein